MADAWLLWAAGVVAILFVTLLSLAGFAAMGLVLGIVIWVAARHAVTPAARADVDASLRRTCDRLPFCNCA